MEQWCNEADLKWAVERDPKKGTQVRNEEMCKCSLWAASGQLQELAVARGRVKEHLPLQRPPTFGARLTHHRLPHCTVPLKSEPGSQAG